MLESHSQHFQVFRVDSNAPKTTRAPPSRSPPRAPTPCLGQGIPRRQRLDLAVSSSAPDANLAIGAAGALSRIGQARAVAPNPTCNPALPAPLDRDWVWTPETRGHLSVILLIKVASLRSAWAGRCGSARGRKLIQSKGLTATLAFCRASFHHGFKHQLSLHIFSSSAPYRRVGATQENRIGRSFPAERTRVDNEECISRSGLAAHPALTHNTRTHMYCPTENFPLRLGYYALDCATPLL